MANSIKYASSRFSASEQLVIKAQCNDDIRKLIIPNENFTVHSLNSLIRRTFDGKLCNSNELIIKYLDDDGDQVTLANDVDLAVALHFHSKLRLFVYADGQESAAAKSNNRAKVNSEGTLIDAKTFAEELKRIRNSVQTVLDRCEIPRASTSEKEKTPEKEASAAPEPAAPIPPTPPREFDPYAHALQRQRSHTPSGVRSRLFTGSRKYPAEQTPPSTPTEPTEPKRPPVAPFPTPFPPAPHLIPSGVNNQFSPMPSPSTPPVGNPNIPLYAARAFPSARHSAANVSPSRSSPVSAFIGQQPTPFQQGSPLASNAPINSPLPTGAYPPPPPTGPNFFNPAQQYFKGS